MLIQEEPTLFALLQHGVLTADGGMVDPDLQLLIPADPIPLAVQQHRLIGAILLMDRQPGCAL